MRNIKSNYSSEAVSTIFLFNDKSQDVKKKIYLMTYEDLFRINQLRLNTIQFKVTGIIITLRIEIYIVHQHILIAFPIGSKIRISHLQREH